MKAAASVLMELLRSGKAPAEWEGFEADLSDYRDCPSAPRPRSICVSRLKAHGWPHAAFPAGWRVQQQLDLSDSPALENLPEGLDVPVLILRNCRSLRALPEGLRVSFLDVTGCTALCEWPASAQVEAGRVTARDCVSLQQLPAVLGPLSSLDLAGCRQIDHIPPGVQVRSWLDVAGTGITGLPEPLMHTGLRWRGVRVDARIAFFPDQITAQEALDQPNAELRRVMIERIGFERFLRDVRAEVVHEDRDPGGPRQLLRVPLENDEPLVVVSVRCPSTDRHYIIRVPPGMKTCHQAVAWTAGFDNPDEYRPVKET